MSIFARFTLALVTTAMAALGGLSQGDHESPGGPGGCCPQAPPPVVTVHVDRTR